MSCIYKENFNTCTAINCIIQKLKFESVGTPFLSSNYYIILFYIYIYILFNFPFRYKLVQVGNLAH